MHCFSLVVVAEEKTAQRSLVKNSRRIQTSWFGLCTTFISLRDTTRRSVKTRRLEKLTYRAITLELAFRGNFVHFVEKGKRGGGGGGRKDIFFQDERTRIYVIV